ncbi:purine nucleoside phosphorylase I, inosine and guanosine-specific [Ostertagia ostertagi]
MQGRFHPYEHNMNLALCAFPVRVMHQLGVKRMVVSNAAGGVNPKFKYGDLMLIKDHIFLPGLAGFSPLVGLNDGRFGARFVSVHDAYDKSLRKLAKDIARRQGILLHEGVYCMSGGPQYESPAEVMMFKTVGADALGMSTCHEVTVATQCGIKVLGFSLITNIANTDVDNAVLVSHAEVLQTAKEAGDRASKFVKEIIKHFPTDSS